MFKLLFGVQLNDEMFFDRNINFLTSRVTVNFAAEIFSVLNQPCRNGFTGKSFSHAFEIFFGTAAFHNGNNVACFYQSGRNIKAFAVNGRVLQSDEPDGGCLQDQDGIQRCQFFFPEG